MAADYARLIAQLRSFYHFTAKAVLLVGARGGRLLDPTKLSTQGPVAIERARQFAGGHCDHQLLFCGAILVLANAMDEKRVVARIDAN